MHIAYTANANRYEQNTKNFLIVSFIHLAHIFI